MIPTVSRSRRIAALDVLGVRRRRDKIAAKPNEHLCTAIDHRLQRVDNGMPMMLRRMKAEYLLDLAKHFGARLLVDPDRPVALDVGVAANRADPRSWPAEISPHQQQIGDLLDVVRALLVLGDPHAVAR